MKWKNDNRIKINWIEKRKKLRKVNAADPEEREQRNLEIVVSSESWIHHSSKERKEGKRRMDSSQNTVGTPVSGGGGGNSIVMSQSTDASPVDSTATASTPTTDESKQNLNQVINSVQKTLGILHQLYLTVSSFNAASQLPLLQRLYYYALLPPFQFIDTTIFFTHSILFFLFQFQK